MEKIQDWKPGELITAERLNRMQELAAQAQETAEATRLQNQIKELRFLCDEQGKLWGAAITPPDGAGGEADLCADNLRPDDVPADNLCAGGRAGGGILRKK